MTIGRELAAGGGALSRASPRGGGQRRVPRWPLQVERRHHRHSSGAGDGLRLDIRRRSRCMRRSRRPCRTLRPIAALGCLPASSSSCAVPGSAQESRPSKPPVLFRHNEPYSSGLQFGHGRASDRFMAALAAAKKVGVERQPLTVRGAGCVVGTRHRCCTRRMTTGGRVRGRAPSSRRPRSQPLRKSRAVMTTALLRPDHEHDEVVIAQPHFG